MATIRREFGFTDDATSGGTSYRLTSPAGTIPDASTFWPITNVGVDKNVDQINRNNEARGRRAISPSRPFKEAPVVTVQVPAYRSVVEKSMRKTLGGVDVVSPGSGVTPQVHALGVLGYNQGPLPAVHASVVRDDLYQKFSGACWERTTLNFPLDGEGTCEAELHALYQANFVTSPPAAVFTGLSDDVLALRDAQAWFDGANEVQTVTITGVPTGGTFKLTVPANTVNVPAGQTAGIAWNAAAAAVQTALEAVVGAGNVTVTGGPGPSTPWAVTFTGAAGGRDVPAMTADSTGLTGGSSPTAAVATTTPGGSSIPDLQGFSFVFKNNTTPKQYAGRNVVSQTLGTPSQTRKLWWPDENKLGAAQDVTGTINFGNVNTQQEFAHEYGQVQKLVFETTGSVLATTPVAVELVRVTVYAATHTGGGAEALTARDDITSNFEWMGGYSDPDSADIKVEVVNAATAAIS